ncbi:MAG: hypothetical protein M1837_000583 [Sclerophora amabilis]|nr:MAG: hypothetical protein M1837_000583 [Sclerophora amabilis]
MSAADHTKRVNDGFVDENRKRQYRRRQHDERPMNPAAMMQKDLANSNSTMHTFIGGKQKAWMTGSAQNERSPWPGHSRNSAPKSAASRTGPSPLHFSSWNQKDAGQASSAKMQGAQQSLRGEPNTSIRAASNVPAAARSSSGIGVRHEQKSNPTSPLLANVLGFNKSSTPTSCVGVLPSPAPSDDVAQEVHAPDDEPLRGGARETGDPSIEIADTSRPTTDTFYPVNHSQSERAYPESYGNQSVHQSNGTENESEIGVQPELSQQLCELISQYGVANIQELLRNSTSHATRGVDSAPAVASYNQPNAIPQQQQNSPNPLHQAPEHRSDATPFFSQTNQNGPPSSNLITTLQSMNTQSPSIKPLTRLIESHINQSGGIEALGRGIDLVRIKVLQEACSIEDCFYLVLHQIYCSYTINPQSVLCTRGLGPGSARPFTIMGQLLRGNESLNVERLKWFSNFPAKQEHLMDHTTFYGRAFQQVLLFLNALPREWDRLHNACWKRDCPPLMDELVGLLNLTSVTLQRVVFTAVHRRLWGSQEDQYFKKIEDLFRINQREFNDFYAKLPPSQSIPLAQKQQRNQEIIAEYQRIRKMQIEASQYQNPPPHNTFSHPARPPPSHVPVASQAQSTTLPSNVAPQAQVNNAQRSRAPPPLQLQSQPPQRHTSATSPGADSPTTGGNLQYLPRRASTISSAPSSTRYTQPGSSLASQAHQRSHQSSPTSLTPQLQAVQVDRMRAQQEALARMGHPIQSSPFLVQEYPGLRSPGMPGSPYSQTPQSTRQPVFPGHAQGINGTPSDTSAHSSYNDPAALPEAYWPYSQLVRDRPSQSHVPLTRTVLPRASAPTQMPANRPLIPAQVSTERSNSNRSSNSTISAIHQAHLRSPHLVPLESDDAANKYYQHVRRFALRPTLLSFKSTILVTSVEIAKETIENIPSFDSTQTLDGRSIRKFRNGSILFRIRCCKLASVAEPCEESQWIVKENVWPDHVFIEVNSIKTEVRRKIHHNRDLPLDITDFVKEGQNEIQIVVLRTESEADVPFAFAVEVIEMTRHDEIIRSCTETNVIPSEQTLKAIQSSLPMSAGAQAVVANGEDDELAVVNSQMTVNVTDPFTARIFDIPVRGAACLHRDCFDLGTFLQTRKTHAQSRVSPSGVDEWKCPLCGGDARPVVLRADGFLKDVRAQLQAHGLLETKAIVVMQDGSWVPKRTQKDERQAGWRPDSKTPGVLPMSGGGHEGQMSPAGGKVVIELDDD